MTVHQIAEALGVTPGQAGVMCAKGEFLGTYDLGTSRRHNWRVPRSQVEKHRTTG